MDQHRNLNGETGRSPLPESQNIPNASQAPEKPEGCDDSPGQKRKKFPFYLLITAALLICMALGWDEVVRWVGDAPEISPERLDKRDKEIKQIKRAEQYALVAEIDGMYECLTCPSKWIFLHAGEIWKYGVTRIGATNRYGGEYLARRKLNYVVQFTGDYAQCLIEEKRKLYDYPILPENRFRPDSLRLVYPPGNMQDK